MALVAEDGKIVRLHIAQTDNIVCELRSFVEHEQIDCIVMGDGTNHEAIGAAVREVFPHAQLHLVGEAHSTEEARSLYWQENPPKGWRVLLPLGLQVPPVPLDAYAAVVQVRRWLQKNKV